VLSNESHRQFSSHLAESPLLQWFCGIALLSGQEVVEVDGRTVFTA
jgi:hypothetical protein